MAITDFKAIISSRHPFPSPDIFEEQKGHMHEVLNLTDLSKNIKYQSFWQVTTDRCIFYFSCLSYLHIDLELFTEVKTLSVKKKPSSGKALFI